MLKGYALEDLRDNGICRIVCFIGEGLFFYVIKWTRFSSWWDVTLEKIGSLGGMAQFLMHFLISALKSLKRV